MSDSRISHVLDICTNLAPPSILFCVWRSDLFIKATLQSQYHFKKAILKLTNLLFLIIEGSQDKGLLL